MATEELTLKVNIDTAGAGKLKEVTSALESLKNISSKGQLGGLTKSLSDLSSAIDTLSKNRGNFSGLLSNIKQLTTGLSKFDASKYTKGLEGAAQVLGKAGEAVTKFSDSSSGLTSTADAFTKIPSALEGMADDDISGKVTKTANVLNDLGRATAGAAKNGTKISDLATGLKRLPDAIKGIASFAGGKDYEGQMSGLGSFISDLDEKVSQFSKDGVKGAGALSNIADSFKTFSKMSDVDFMGSISDGMMNAVDATKAFVNNMNAAVSDSALSKFSTLADAVDKITSGMSKMASATKKAGTALKETGGSSSKVAMLGKGLMTFADSAAGAVSELFQGGGLSSKVDAFVGSLSEMAPILGEFTQIGVSGFRDMFSSLTKGNNIVEKINNGFMSMSKTGLKLVSTMGLLPIQKLTMQVGGLLKHVRELSRIMLMSVLYSTVFGGLRLITDGLKQGITNLYEWARVANDPFKATMDSLATSLQYFQNSVAAAVSPILDALAPAIEYLTNAIARLLNMLGQLIAALSGRSTFRKAVRSQKEFAAATKTATGAAKKQNDELKKTILAFDELNILQKPNEKSGGGGGGGAAVPDYGGMFETAPIDDYFKQLANSDDWTSLGVKIADGINHWMDGIDWDGIENTADKWSKRVYTAFNGAIGQLHWDDLGVTIGKGLNVVLGFFDDIAQNTRWGILGQDLGIALNNAFSTIDWSLLGRTLTNGIKIALELLHGFMKTFNWNDFRTDIQTGIKAAFDNINLSEAAIDLSNLAHQILLTIDAAIQAVPWDEIGDALEQVDWTQIFTDILTILGDLFVGLVESHLSTVVFPAIGGKIGGAIGGLVGHPIIGTAIGMLAGWIISEITTIFTDPEKIEEIKEKLSNALTKAITFVKDNPGLTAAIATLAGIFTGLAIAIKTLGGHSEEAEPKTSKFSNTMNGMVKLGAGILMIGAGFALIADGAAKIGEAGTGANVALGIMSGTLVVVIALVGKLGPGITAATPGLLSLSVLFIAVGAAVKLVVDAIGNLITKIAEAADPISKIISTISDGVVDIINSIADGIVKVNNSLPTAADGFEKLAKAVTKLVVGTNLADLVITLGSLSGAIKKIGKQGDNMTKVASAMSKFADALKSVNGVAGSAGTSLDTLAGKIKSLSKTKDDLGKLRTSVEDDISAMSRSFSNAKFDMPKVKSSDFKSSLDTANTTANTYLNNLEGKFTKATFSLNKVKTSSFDTSLKDAGTTTNTKLNSISDMIKRENFSLNNVDYSGAVRSLDNAYTKLKQYFDRIAGIFNKTLTIKFDNKVTVPSFWLSGRFDAKNNKTPKVNATSTTIRWYADAMEEGRILDNATIFGMANGRLLGGGERGQEAVVGTQSLRNMIESAVSEALSVNGSGNAAPQVDVQIVADGEVIYRLSQQGKKSIDNRYHVAGAM